MLECGLSTVPIPNPPRGTGHTMRGSMAGRNVYGNTYGYGHMELSFPSENSWSQSLGGATTCSNAPSERLVHLCNSGGSPFHREGLRQDHFHGKTLSSSSSDDGFRLPTINHCHGKTFTSEKFCSNNSKSLAEDIFHTEILSSSSLDRGLGLADQHFHREALLFPSVNRGLGLSDHHFHGETPPWGQLRSWCGLEELPVVHSHEQTLPSPSWNDGLVLGGHHSHGETPHPEQLCCLGDSEGLAEDHPSPSPNEGESITATFASRLRLCSNAKALSEGRHVHFDLINLGYDHVRFFGNLLIEMYGHCQSLGCARSVFTRLSSPNLYSWTMLIKAYAENGDGDEALQLFAQMKETGVQADEIAFISILRVCGNLKALQKGRRIHAESVSYGFHLDTVVGNALIDMYGKCESPHDAMIICEKIILRNVITWSALISACVQNGQNKEALVSFKKMLAEGIKPDKVAFASVLGACASHAAQEEGRCIHASIINSGFDLDVIMGNALINMYGKCGGLDSARIVFDKMHFRNTITWTSIMMVYAQHGRSSEVLLLFSHMQMEGIKPDEITYVAVLTACSHAGLVDIAKSCFASMNDCSITALLEHYVCMIDLLGRAGQLDAAEGLIKDMPLKCNAPALLSFLSVCRTHGDIERGVCAADTALVLDPENTSPYSHLLNFYAAAGRWKEFASVRKAKKIAIKRKRHQGLV